MYVEPADWTDEISVEEWKVCGADNVEIHYFYSGKLRMEYYYVE